MKETNRGPTHSFSCDSKYRIVAETLRGREGTLLDVGARDRRLAQELDLSLIKYFSADVDEPHDYMIDLERGLSLPDRSFDFVVALDVLEHVEQIHVAFRELARITRSLFIVALPNMATLSKRWSYLLRGHLGTEKYDLPSEPPPDRHRWLTVYSQIRPFVEASSTKAGLVVEKVVDEVGGGGRTRSLTARVAEKVPWTRPLLSERSIYFLRVV